MQCLSGGIRVKHPTGHTLLLPCGQCLACRINYAQQWSSRCSHEAQGKDCSFVTLTYEDEYLPSSRYNDCSNCSHYNKGHRCLEGSLCKKDLQKFIKTLRQNLHIRSELRNEPEQKIRYYACGEYGEQFGRPHYHLLIFGLDDSEHKIVQDSWNKGIVSVDEFNPTTINYVTGYITKKLTGEIGKNHYADLGQIPPYSTMSLRPAIGLEWYEKNKHTLEKGYLLNKKGVKIAIPRYYKNKINSKNTAMENTINGLTTYYEQCEEKVREEIEDSQRRSSNGDFKPRSLERLEKREQAKLNIVKSNNRKKRKL
jgi:hypothetical protein